MQGGPAIAYKVTPEFSVGASAHLVFSMLEFQMPYSLSPTIMRGVVNPANGMTFGDMFAGPPAQGGFGYTEVTAAAKMSDLTAFGFSGKVGIAWKPNEKATFGLSYTSPSALTYKKGKAGMDMTAQLSNAFGKAMQGYMMQNPTATVPQAQAAVTQQFGQLGIDMSKGVVANYDLDVKLKFPQSIAVGAGVKLSEDLLVGFDFEWINWQNAFDKMTLNLANGNNTNINRMLGNAGTFSLDFPMKWEDAYAIRLGVELAASKALTLRAGGAFGSNPVVSETVFPVFPAIVENHVMVGASYQVSAPITVHLAYEHALNNSQSCSGDNLVAEEFCGSTSQLSENIFHLSLSWGL
jgi:long-subunit fatty acid transport protein